MAGLRWSQTLLFGLFVAGAFLAPARGQAAGGPVYLEVVQRYADTLIDKARDTYGPEKSGLILSAFDRETLKPLTTRPAPPGGVRRGDRSGLPWVALTGANPQLDENLLRVLYVLTELTGNPRYGKVANEELKWFLEHTQSPATGLFPWGEHLSWDVMSDKSISGGDDRMHEFARPWMLWDRCYDLAPEPCKRFAVGLWENQIANHKTGGFDRHAPIDKPRPVDGKDFPRHAGFYIGTWAYAYKHTKDPLFPTAIETLLARFEKKRVQKDGQEAATIGPLDVETAAALVPEPLASRLKAFAAKEDELIIKDLRKEHGKPDGSFSFKPTWEAGYSSGVTADWAMFAQGRYEQVPRKEYRDIVIAVADCYLGKLPDEDVDVWPMSVAHVISAEVAAYRFTKRDVYLDQARQFARMAIDMFWQDNPLPRASFKTGHYEAITGADSLALSLLDLNVALNPSTVKIPSNSIDR
jgi:hypothetical protein